MSKKISLTQNKFAIVDDEDYSKLSNHKWCALKSGRTFYAVRQVRDSVIKKRLSISIHNQILGIKWIDHISGDGLDNRRCNLRSATNSQNQANCHKQNRKTSSRYKGVHWDKRENRWHACIKKDGKSKHLGTFGNECRAAFAYDIQAKKLFGKYARLNFL